MFEAHIYSDTNLATEDQLSELSDNRHYQCWHANYHCNVRVWLASGKRLTDNQIFLYIEYRNRDNSHGYKKVEISSTSLSINKLNQIVCQQVLGENLDPIKTELWSKS